MKRFLIIAALFAALSFVSTAADAKCRPLRSVLQVAAAPVRAVVQVRPARSVLRVAVLPVRAVRAVRR